MKKIISILALAVTCIAANAQQPTIVKDSTSAKWKHHDSTFVKKDHDSSEVKKDHDSTYVGKGHDSTDVKKHRDTTDVKKDDDTTAVVGCHDRFSFNYNPKAKKSDGSCVRVPLTFNVHKLKNRHVTDTLSIKPLVDCDFDFKTAVDSARITYTNHTSMDNDSTAVTWEIYQGKKISKKHVKYGVHTPGDKLFVLSVTCPTSNKMESAPQAITLADVGNGSVVTATKHLEEENNLSVYPNPAVNEINIGGHLNEVHKIAVYSIFGHEVYASNAAERKIDISALPAGHYFVKIYHGTSVQVVRFVK